MNVEATSGETSSEMTTESTLRTAMTILGTVSSSHTEEARTVVLVSAVVVPEDSELAGPCTVRESSNTVQSTELNVFRA